MKAQLIKEVEPSGITWWKVRILKDDGSFDSVEYFREDRFVDNKSGEERAKMYFEAAKKWKFVKGEEVVEEWDSSTNQTT